MNKLKMYICHSFDDNVQNELFPDYAQHIDLRHDKNNQYLNEVTLWTRPIDFFKDAEYVSIGHYRRYLDIDLGNLSKDTILAHKTQIQVSQKTLFELYHDKEYLAKFLNLYKNQDFENWLSNTRIFYDRNIFCMHKSVFQKYHAFINETLKLLIQVKSEMADSNVWKNVYDKRCPGALAERLTSYFIQSSGLKVENRKIVELKIGSPYQRDEISLEKLRNRYYKMRSRGDL